MILLAVGLIIAVLGRPTPVEVSTDTVDAKGERRYRDVPAPTAHVVTWAVVCVVLAAALVTLGALEQA